MKAAAVDEAVRYYVRIYWLNVAEHGQTSTGGYLPEGPSLRETGKRHHDGVESSGT